MTCQEVPRTRLEGSKTKAMLEDKRRKRIREAMNWESGTRDSPREHLLTTLPNGLDVYFMKPGKEVFEEPSNPYDMLPVVGSPDTKLKFEDVWSLLSKISIVDFDGFKAVLALVYRSAYMLDHTEKSGSVIRYEPNQDIARCVERIDTRIGGVSPFGLMGLLHFLDILGWNEDVKYHVEDSMPTFSGKYDFRVGRINTLLTCIRVPYQASLFVTHCLSKANEKNNIDFSLLYTIMQQFAKSRGTCTPTKRQLIDWLSPYIIENRQPRL